jgi:hypothetical protein
VVGLQQLAELGNDSLGGERRPYLAQRVEHHGLASVVDVPDRECHAVGRTAGRVDERRVADAGLRRALEYAMARTGLHRLGADEGLKIGAELGEVFRLGARCVALHRAIDYRLRQRRVHGARRRLRDQNQRIAAGSKMTAVGLPHLAAAGVRRRDDEQRPLRGGEAGANRVQDLGVRVGRDLVGKPKCRLVGDHGDEGRTAQPPERRRAHLDGEAVGQVSNLREAD